MDINGYLVCASQQEGKAKPSIVFVPTEQITLVEVFVPGKRASDWKQALPFVLEEQLAQSVEQLFFAVLHRQTSGEKAGFVSVAVVEKERLKNWLEELKAHDLADAELVPDVFSVTFSTEKTHAVMVDNKVLARTAEFKGLTGTEELVTQLIHISGANPLDINESHLVSENKLALLKAKSLRKGQFAVASSNNNQLFLWKWPLFLFLAILAIVIASYIIETQKLQQQQQAYAEQTTALFKQMFPNTKRIVNVRAQTKSKLALQQGGKSEQGFAELMKKIEPVLMPLMAQGKLQINAISWQKQKLTLLLLADNVDTLQLITDKLNQQNQAELKLKQINTASEKTSLPVEGEIYVK